MNNQFKIEELKEIADRINKKIKLLETFSVDIFFRFCKEKPENQQISRHLKRHVDCIIKHVSIEENSTIYVFCIDVLVFSKHEAYEYKVYESFYRIIDVEGRLDRALYIIEKTLMSLQKESKNEETKNFMKEKLNEFN